MAASPPYPGQLPAENFRAMTGTGGPASANDSVFPIVSQDENGVLIPIGTGFFIGEHGLFVTAAHIVHAVLNEHGQAKGPFGILQHEPGNRIVIRPITRTTHHEVADVAVGFAAPMHSKSTGKPLTNTLMTLARMSPRVGDSVHTYAFPRTQVEPGKPQVLKLTPGAYAGTITAHYPTGRDSVLLPGPCYETTMTIHGGASGGPVFNKDGRVIAVNSTGVDGTNIGFVSCITSILSLRLEDVRLPGDPAGRAVLVQELCDRGFIPVL